MVRIVATVTRVAGGGTAATVALGRGGRRDRRAGQPTEEARRRSRGRADPWASRALDVFFADAGVDAKVAGRLVLGLGVDVELGVVGTQGLGAAAVGVTLATMAAWSLAAATVSGHRRVWRARF